MDHVRGPLDDIFEARVVEAFGELKVPTALIAGEARTELLAFLGIDSVLKVETVGGGIFKQGVEPGARGVHPDDGRGLNGGVRIRDGFGGPLLEGSHLGQQADVGRRRAP